ncbi:hypothetical protein ACFVFS_04550 [Kitasatospora sp. NPDC057692]|uniref:hypothetical protein n=1 Tax=Kitasatospora sp. NPDC057692 TaxID=3346215 RepID=UPI0036B4F847
MDRSSPITSVRRYGWLPALALAAVAVAGCSSSGGGSTAAASSPAAAPTATGAPSTPAPAATTGTTAPAPTTTAPATAAPAPTATTGGTPTGAGKRPADACTLLTSPQVIAAVGTGGPFTGTRPDPKDGKPVWGCTWGSRQSYAHIREMDPALFTSLKTNPDFTATPIPGTGQDAYLLRRKDGRMPEVNFLASDGHAYSVEVVKDRGPGDDVNADAEAAAATGLALLLSKSV